MFKNGHKSTSDTVECGVPQCSVLEPPLFIIYANDLPNSVNNANNCLLSTPYYLPMILLFIFSFQTLLNKVNYQN